MYFSYAYIHTYTDTPICVFLMRIYVYTPTPIRRFFTSIYIYNTHIPIRLNLHTKMVFFWVCIDSSIHESIHELFLYVNFVYIENDSYIDVHI